MPRRELVRKASPLALFWATSAGVQRRGWERLVKIGGRRCRVEFDDDDGWQAARSGSLFQEDWR